MSRWDQTPAKSSGWIYQNNSNPNHGRIRKEKQMNVITKATSVAVLVTLGLALAAECEVSPRQVVAASAGDGTGGQR